MIDFDFLLRFKYTNLHEPPEGYVLAFSSDCGFCVCRYLECKEYRGFIDVHGSGSVRHVDFWAPLPDDFERVISESQKEEEK